MTVAGVAAQQHGTIGQSAALHTTAWCSFVREKYGTEPSVTYFECPVVVDNVAQQIIADE
jgi:hypothetical protein